jgi:hypothetical protein
VFETTLGARVGARASARRADFAVPTPGDLAQILLAIFSLGAAAALLIGWLLLSDSRRPEISGMAPASDCASLGRGGVYCPDHPVSAGQSNAGSAEAGDCPSIGRAGRVCIEHPGDISR